MSRILGTTLAVAMAIGALTASASADGLIRRDVQVKYSDLNVNTEAGASELLHRIDYAAREACGGSPAFDSMYPIMPEAVTREFAKCHRNAVSGAVAYVRSPLLTRIYTQKGEPSFQRFADR